MALFVIANESEILYQFLFVICDSDVSIISLIEATCKSEALEIHQLHLRRKLPPHLSLRSYPLINIGRARLQIIASTFLENLVLFWKTKKLKVMEQSTFPAGQMQSCLI